MDAKVRFISHPCNSDFSSFCSQDAQLTSHNDYFCCVLTMQFANDALAMIVDGVDADMQFIGYLLTGLASADFL